MIKLPENCKFYFQIIFIIFFPLKLKNFVKFFYFKLINFLDWTKDIDKKILVDLINENPLSKWDKIKVDSNIKIYKKKVIINIRKNSFIDRKQSFDSYKNNSYCL